VASEPVKSVCVVGAGYVGRSINQKAKSGEEYRLTMDMHQAAQRQRFWRCITHPSRWMCSIAIHDESSNGSRRICRCTNPAWKR
jgi:hypothetical protein